MILGAQRSVLMVLIIAAILVCIWSNLKRYRCVTFNKPINLKVMTIFGCWFTIIECNGLK